MSRATALLRALQRLPAASTGFGETSSALRAALSSSSLTEASKDVFPGSRAWGSFNPQLRNPAFSFAAQMHSLSRKEEENNLPSHVAQPMTQVPRSLAALPPKARMPMNPLNRGMAHAAEEHLEMNQAHPFHILPPSPWPFKAAQGSLTMMLGMSAWFHAIPHGGIVMFTGLGSLIATATAWWRDCIIESDMGMHTEVQKNNLIQGVWLFIASEAALFFALLWACVHLGMSPNVWVQMQWPPVGIDAIGWEGRALVMSAVLAASYYSANVAVVAQDPKAVVAALATTIGLGGLFLADQYLEYSTAPFTITDGPYGTTFFITTGFHGFHVFIGSMWLLAALANYVRYNKPTVTLKTAVLYWHFVDIVWIAVYGIIYAAQL